MTDGLRVVLSIVDGFVALTAIGGGLALALGLEESRFEPELLEGTPFRSYVVPGLLLAVVIGGSAAVATVAMVHSTGEGMVVSALAGLLLMGWIVGEVAILDQPGWTWIEILYFATGFAMLVGSVWLMWTESL